MTVAGVDSYSLGHKAPCCRSPYRESLLETVADADRLSHRSRNCSAACPQCSEDYPAADVVVAVAPAAELAAGLVVAAATQR